MKTIPLRDHEMPHDKYSAFELELQRRNAVLKATVEVYTTPEGVKYARLTDPILVFDETRTDVAALRKLVEVHGFQTR